MQDPFKIKEPTVISFSGGRTSAYLLWRVLQSNNGLPDDAIVCFANTGKEEEATLQFVKDCEDKWNVPITWLEYVWHEEPSQRFKVVDFNIASRNGEPFEAVINSKNFLPNTMMRFCTQEMKIFTINRYLKSIGWNDYVVAMGIRADEPRRVAKVSANKYGKFEKITPLANDNISERDVWDFWNKQDFDLGLPNMNGCMEIVICVF
jgi:3'-phosphoadenosine 5'-phosphosulfate sulfotransferase (PAPS reductase)/FAD synthetase